MKRTPPFLATLAAFGLLGASAFAQANTAPAPQPPSPAGRAGAESTVQGTGATGGVTDSGTRTTSRGSQLAPGSGSGYEGPTVAQDPTRTVVPRATPDARTRDFVPKVPDPRAEPPRPGAEPGTRDRRLGDSPTVATPVPAAPRTGTIITPSAGTTGAGATTGSGAVGTGTTATPGTGTTGAVTTTTATVPRSAVDVGQPDASPGRGVDTVAPTGTRVPPPATLPGAATTGASSTR